MSAGRMQRKPGRPREFDDGRVVASAMELFWRKGYAGASVPDISVATGLSTSSIYNAYESKLALFVAALDRYLDFVDEQLLGPLEHGSAGLADIGAFLERLEAASLLGAPRGCLAVNTIAEFRHPPRAVAARTKRYRATLRRALRAAMDRAAANDEIVDTTIDESVGALAAIVVAFNLLVASRATVKETRGLILAAHAIVAARSAAANPARRPGPA